MTAIRHGHALQIRMLALHAIECCLGQHIRKLTADRQCWRVTQSAECAPHDLCSAGRRLNRAHGIADVYIGVELGRASAVFAVRESHERLPLRRGEVGKRRAESDFRLLDRLLPAASGWKSTCVSTN